MKSAKSILKDSNIYFGEETIAGIPCSVGYIRKFKWSWFATQLNMFIFIGNTNDRIDKVVIENFSKCCYEYSLKNNQGWPRGLQSGVGSISILQGKSIENDAIEFCETLTKKHWSAFEIPVLYDINHSLGIRFKQNPMWGTMFLKFFAETIDSIFSKFN